MGSLVSNVASSILPHALKWLRQVGGVLHQIWLEVIGTLFLGMGALAAPSAIKEWRAYQQGHSSVMRPLLVAVFILLTVGFGIGSFFRARRIRER